MAGLKFGTNFSSTEPKRIHPSLVSTAVYPPSPFRTSPVTKLQHWLHPMRTLSSKSCSSSEESPESVHVNTKKIFWAWEFVTATAHISLVQQSS